MANNPALLHRIIDRGLQILIDEQAILQVDLYRKFQSLEINLSKATISNLWRKKPSVSIGTIRKAARGIQYILQREFCLEFDPEIQDYLPIPNCKPRPLTVLLPPPPPPPPLPFQLHDGRLNVADKVAFYQKAKNEIIEVGIRLKNFRNYFLETRESAFREPICHLLENGVNFKCFVLNPQGNCARRYIEDRQLVQANEANLLKEIPHFTDELRQEFVQLNRMGFPGRMSLYQYDHIPYYHACVTDGNTTDNARILITPYLYGVSRANSPVIEVNRRQQLRLYQRYWRSVQSLTRPPQLIQIV